MNTHKLTNAFPNSEVRDNYRLQGNPFVLLSDYDLKNIPHHLEEAGLTDDMHALLSRRSPTNRNAWFEITFSNNRLPFYLGHLRRALHILNASSKATIADNNGKVNIAKEIYYGLTISSVNTLVYQLPPFMVSGLLSSGIWTLEQAVSFIMQHRDWSSRTERLFEILPTVLQEKDTGTIEYVLGLFKGRPRGDESRNSVGVGPLDENDNPPNYQEEYLKARIVRQFSVYADDETTLPLLSLMEQIRVPWSRADALNALSTRAEIFEQDEWQKVTQNAWNMARGIGKPSLKGESLALLAACLQEPLRSEALLEAFECFMMAFNGHIDEERFRFTPKTGIMEIYTRGTELKNFMFGIFELAKHASKAIIDHILQKIKSLDAYHQDIVLTCLCGAFERLYSKQEALAQAKKVKDPYLKLISNLSLSTAGDPETEFRGYMKSAEFTGADFECQSKVEILKKFSHQVTGEILYNLSEKAESVDNNDFVRGMWEEIALLMKGLEEQQRVQLIDRLLNKKDRANDDPLFSSSVITFFSREQLLQRMDELQNLEPDRAMAQKVAQAIEAGIKQTEAKAVAGQAGTDLLSDWTKEIVSAALMYARKLVETANESPDHKLMEEQAEKYILESGMPRKFNDVYAMTIQFSYHWKREQNEKAAGVLMFMIENLPGELLAPFAEVVKELKDEYWKLRLNSRLCKRLTDDGLQTSVYNDTLREVLGIQNNERRQVLIDSMIYEVPVQRPLESYESWSAELLRISADFRRHVLDYIYSALPLLNTFSTSKFLQEIPGEIEKVLTEWGNAHKETPIKESDELKTNSDDEEYQIGLSTVESAIAAFRLATYFVEQDDLNAVLPIYEWLLEQTGDTNGEIALFHAFADLSFLLVQKFTEQLLYENVQIIYDNARYRLRPIAQNEEGRKIFMELIMNFALDPNDHPYVSLLSNANDDLSWLMTQYGNDEELLARGLLGMKLIQQRTTASHEGKTVRRAGPGSPETGSKDNIPGEFQNKLKETGMLFYLPNEFQGIKGKPKFSHALHGIKGHSVPLEAYYFIRSNDEHTGNDIQADFADLLKTCCEGPVPPFNMFPAGSVAAEFGAEQGGSIQFDLKQDKGYGYQRAMAIVLHATGLAHSCILCLYDDYFAVQQWLKEAFYSLRFAQLR